MVGVGVSGEYGVGGVLMGGNGTSGVGVMLGVVGEVSLDGEGGPWYPPPPPPGVVGEVSLDGEGGP